jgi:hypothetical protein
MIRTIPIPIPMNFDISDTSDESGDSDDIDGFGRAPARLHLDTRSALAPIPHFPTESEDNSLADEASKVVTLAVTVLPHNQLRQL